MTMEHDWVAKNLSREALLELIDQFVSADDIWGIYCDELNELVENETEQTEEEETKSAIWKQINAYWRTGENSFLVEAMTLIQKSGIEDSRGASPRSGNEIPCEGGPSRGERRK